MLSNQRDGRIVTVDGEEFRIQVSEDGSTHCDWLTGPHPGYGLSIGRPAVFVREGQVPLPDELGLTDEQLVQAIRDFLAAINPETGYLD